MRNYILFALMIHFQLLAWSKIGTPYNPGVIPFLEMVATLLDTMAKGVFFDLLESFEVTFAMYQMPDSWWLLDGCVQFVCRTVYGISFGVLAFHYGDRLMKRFKRDG